MKSKPSCGSTIMITRRDRYFGYLRNKKSRRRDVNAGERCAQWAGAEGGQGRRPGRRAGPSPGGGRAAVRRGWRWTGPDRGVRARPDPGRGSARARRRPCAVHACRYGRERSAGPVTGARDIAIPRISAHRRAVPGNPVTPAAGGLPYAVVIVNAVAAYAAPAPTAPPALPPPARRPPRTSPGAPGPAGRRADSTGAERGIPGRGGYPALSGKCRRPPAGRSGGHFREMRGDARFQAFVTSSTSLSSSRPGVLRSNFTMMKRNSA